MIELQGVRVHNLKNVSLKIPLHRLIVITGVSGSGKSSLAFDTLYAEGQRRYIESFSAYARQFLDRLERPDADCITSIPPAIAIRQTAGISSSRATVATATEIHDYLRLLYAKFGRVLCPGCGAEIANDTPARVLEHVRQLAKGTRYQICFPIEAAADTEREAAIARLHEDGFRRAIVDGRVVDLRDSSANSLWVIVDRLVAGTTSEQRDLDSLELAFRYGDDRCLLLAETAADQPERRACEENVEHVSNVLVLSTNTGTLETCPTKQIPQPRPGGRITVDGRSWDVSRFNARLVCDDCHREFQAPEPSLFSFQSPLGACPTCHGLGELPANSSAHDICPDCGGDRLQPQSLAVRIGSSSSPNIAEFCRLPIAEAERVLSALWDRFDEDDRRLSRVLVEQIRSRLSYLSDVGLGYLTLDRPMRTLSGGEVHRAALTAALGSNLVNTLYVLDEPSAGLHPRDSRRVIDAVGRLRRAGNTVIVVEHDDAFIRAGDEVIDIGPGAGRAGGEVVFQGTPDELAGCERSVTGAYLSGRSRIEPRTPQQRRVPSHGAIKLEGARQHTLKNLTVEFPLGVLCVVTGVSGSGKSTLVEETLYPALCRVLRQSGPDAACGAFDRISGADQIDEVILVDQSPIGRTPRGNPITYMKAFGEIRQTFAATSEARVRNFTAKHFSFNSHAGGRCSKCKGNGSIRIDMQFLADLAMKCPECHGTRYRREILEVKYRGLTIAEVLAMTVGDAFVFFRGQPQLQRRLKFLKDVGLDYLPLGQPATTLSGGESQRLKIASFLASGSRARTLFILNEPTVGLHPADVRVLLSCFDSLLDVGHSLIVIEHNLDVIQSADHIIDLGPDAGAVGGQLVACGPPESIAAADHSLTGRCLREAGILQARST